MSVKLEFVRKMTAEQFKTYQECEKMDDLFLAHFLAELFEDRYKNRDFIKMFRDMLSYESSTELQLAIEGDSKYMP